MLSAVCCDPTGSILLLIRVPLNDIGVFVRSTRIYMRSSKQVSVDDANFRLQKYIGTTGVVPYDSPEYLVYAVLYTRDLVCFMNDVDPVSNKQQVIHVCLCLELLVPWRDCLAH